jgi:hypothetical protein
MSTASSSLPTPGASPASPPAPRTRHYPKPVWLAILAGRHLRDCHRYRRSGTTPYEARINIRRLFRLTNGRFNDLAAHIDGLLHPPRPLPADEGVLEELGTDALPRVTARFRADGIYRFPRRLDAAMLTRLLDFARTAPCCVYDQGTIRAESIPFDPTDLRGTRYQVDDQPLHENEDIQRLAGDMSLLRLAQACLRCRPVFTGCTMWWSSAYGPEPDDHAAQPFHFDMNQIKFLKLFIYLNDVGQHNGPHVFVRGSHHRLPRELLEDRRFTDEEILAHYPSDRVVTVTGPAGAVFIEDTRGLHKGTHLRKGHRLCLQLQWATHGLGGAPERITLNDRFAPWFHERVARYPRVFGAKFRRSPR